MLGKLESHAAERRRGDRATRPSCDEGRQCKQANDRVNGLTEPAGAAKHRVSHADVEAVDGVVSVQESDHCPDEHCVGGRFADRCVVLDGLQLVQAA